MLLLRPPFCHRRHRSTLRVLAAFAIGCVASARADPLQELIEQNKLMRAQLEAQQRQLDELRVQMSVMRESVSAPPAESAPREETAGPRVSISGEVGFSFFSSGKDGRYPNEEFRVDDANLHLEARIARRSYFFGELQLSKNETSDENFHLGEFYVEFEDVSGALGGPERLVNLRIGRVDVPFGEEYLNRDPLTNPLISHSVSDVWGTDEGIELYGELGRADFAFAILNGSSRRARDFNADKSVAMRVGFDVLPRLHVSASAMRTGELNSAAEPLSEIWIGNNVFRNIGSADSTTHEAELAEIDARYAWNSGHLWFAGGRARYRDNDPSADNTRRFSYFQIEGVQSLAGNLYGALRYSSLRTGRGYPLAGIGNFGKYFLGSLKTRELQRLSLGGGYRFSTSLLFKLDYTLEQGELTTGVDRNNRMFAAQAAIGF